MSAASRVFLALDFDGTLAPIVGRPEDAALPAATASLLRVLAASEPVTLAIASGRAIPDLRRLVALDCFYIGNHGLEIEGPGLSFVHPDALLRRSMLHCACADLDAALGGLDGAFLERKGLSATVHFRQVDEDLHGRVRGAVFSAIRPYSACLGVVPARKALEIRPLVAWSKGAALQFVIERSGSARPLVICAGDDDTDETMFRADPEAISIHVGSDRETSAHYTLPGPAELASFLGLLRFD